MPDRRRHDARSWLAPSDRGSGGLCKLPGNSVQRRITRAFSPVWKRRLSRREQVGSPAPLRSSRAAATTRRSACTAPCDSGSCTGTRARRGRPPPRTARRLSRCRHPRPRGRRIRRKRSAARRHDRRRRRRSDRPGARCEDLHADVKASPHMLYRLKRKRRSQRHCSSPVLP